MKALKIIALTVSLFILHEKLSAQLVLSEDFSQGIPGTWKVINNDGLTPEASVSFVTNGWVAMVSATSNFDSVAVSTSKYNPAGTADDWLITPALALGSSSLLSWNARALDAAFPDGYEVRISTTTDTIPGFLAHAALFSVSVENSSWTKRSFDLAGAGYANQTVYLAFRNNSTNKYLLALDDIVVFDCTLLNADAGTIDSSTTTSCAGSPALNLGLSPNYLTGAAGNTINGKTNEIPDWFPLPGRPFEDGDCCHNPNGNPPYDIVAFQVDATGVYDIVQLQTGYDGLMLIYTDPLDLTQNPPVTFVAGNDDGDSVGVSEILDTLNAGQTYYLISTGYEDNDFGNYSTTFTGPGNISLQQSGINDLPYDYDFVTVNSSGTIVGLGDDLSNSVTYPGSAAGDTFKVCGVSYVAANLNLTTYIGNPLANLVNDASFNSCADVTASCHTVIIHPEFSITVTGGDTVCNGTEALISATGGTSYIWNTGDSTSGFLDQPDFTTTYSVTATNNYGCTASGQVTVLVFTADGGLLDQDTTVACEGDTSLAISLTPDFSENFAINPSGQIIGNTASVFTWAPLPGRPYDDGTCCSGYNPIYDVQRFSVDQSGQYAVVQQQIGYDGYILIYTDPLDLTQNPPVTFVAGNDDSAGTSGVSFIDSAFFLKGQVYYLISTGFSTGDYGDYITTINGPGNVLTIGQPDSQFFSYDYVTVNSSGTVMALGADLSNSTTYPGSPTGNNYQVCAVSYVSDSINIGLYVGSSLSSLSGISCLDVSDSCHPVKILTPPVANAGPDDTICPGTMATLNANTPASGVGTWALTGAGTVNSPNDPHSTVSGLASGSHRLVWIINNGYCTDSDTMNVFVDTPIADAGPDTSTCKGKNVTLTATGGVSYVWSTLSTSSSTTVAPLATTTYSVTIFDGNGCTATDTVTVNVIPPPTIGLQDASFCPGSSTILDAGNPGSSYAWSNGGTTRTISVNSAGSYSVTVTDTNSCSASDTASVTVGSGLTVNLADHTICNGDSIILNAGNPGSSYSWTTGASTQTITVKNTGTYSVTVSDSTGCTGVGNSTISFYPVPTVDAGLSTTICGGDTVTLTATGNGNLSWSTGDTTASIRVHPTATKKYFAIVTDSNGCTALDSVTVFVNPAPVVTTTSGTQICLGDTVVLNASGGVSYLWSNSSTNSSIRVSPLTTTGYSVTATDNNNCSASTATTVTVNIPPMADAGPNDTVCAGISTTLTATGGANYSWSTGGSTASITVAPAANSTYFVTVTDVHNCSASDSVTLFVNSLPAVAIDTFPSPVFCIGNAALTLTGNPPGGNFLGNGVSGTQFNPTIADTGLQVVYYSFKDSNGCTGYDSTTVLVDVCTGSKLPESHEVRIYPNPASEALFVELPETPKAESMSFIKMFDMVGRSVLEINLNPESATLIQLNTSMLPEANYWVVVNLNGKKVTTQITKSGF